MTRYSHMLLSFASTEEVICRRDSLLIAGIHVYSMLAV